MYDIKPLEEEWKKYQLKKRKPIYLVLFLLTLLIIIFFSVLNFSSVNKYIDNVNNKSIMSKKVNKSSLLKNNALSRLEREEYDKNINTRDDLTIDKSLDVLVDIPILDATDNIGTNNNPHKKIYLDIIETSSAKAYEDVEKRFKQSQDIDDALFLAKSYYKKHNYEKAEYWAYELNKLDANLEESLFIFVQAKVKLGHIPESISILKSYITKSNSEEAKKLLYKIENNK